MPPQATHTLETVDLSELGFDADSDADVTIGKRDDETIVEADHIDARGNPTDLAVRESNKPLRPDRGLPERGDQNL